MGQYDGYAVARSGEYYPTDAPSTGLGQVSIGKELELEIAHLTKQLEVKKQMQALFKANPAIEAFMNLSRGILPDTEPQQMNLPFDEKG